MEAPTLEGHIEDLRERVKHARLLVRYDDGLGMVVAEALDRIVDALEALNAKHYDD